MKLEFDSLEELRKFVAKDLITLGTHVEKKADRCPWCGEVVAGAFACSNGFSLHPDCYRDIEALKAKGG